MCRGLSDERLPVPPTDEVQQQRHGDRRQREQAEEGRDAENDLHIGNLRPGEPVSQIDLNTVLLTIVLAISGWTLTTVLRHVKALTQIEQQLWGKDGRNGHHRDIELIQRGLRAVERGLARMSRRLERLEEHSGIHRKYQADADDDPEDDRSHGDAES